MIPENLATYSDNELENKAERELRMRVDIEHTAPINVELLVERMPNVSLGLQDSLRAKHGVEGVVLKSSDDSRGIQVRIDSQVFLGPWNIYMAALCEEYAHICLHQSLFLYIKTADDFIRLQSDPQWARHERDAKRYSDAIRMPRRLLATETDLLYKRLVDERGFSDTLATYDLIRSRLADKFRVSTSDMRRRFQQSQVGLEDRLLSSLQSRSKELLTDEYTVVAQPRYTQAPLFDFDKE